MHRCIRIYRQRPLIHCLTLIFYRVVSISWHPNANSYLAQVCQISVYIVENESLCALTCYSEFFLHFSFTFCTYIKVVFFPLFWMPCSPHPHMPSSIFFCLALWLLLLSRSRWRVRPSFSFCSNVPRESGPFPWLLPLPLSPVNFRNHTFQLSIGMSMCSACSLHCCTHFLTLYLFSVHAWCSEIWTSSPEWRGGWSSWWRFFIICPSFWRMVEEL